MAWKSAEKHCSRLKNHTFLRRKCFAFIPLRARIHAVAHVPCAVLKRTASAVQQKVPVSILKRASWLTERACFLRVWECLRVRSCTLRVFPGWYQLHTSSTCNYRVLCNRGAGEWRGLVIQVHLPLCLQWVENKGVWKKMDIRAYKSNFCGVSLISRHGFAGFSINFHVPVCFSREKVFSGKKKEES